MSVQLTRRGLMRLAGAAMVAPLAPALRRPEPILDLAVAGTWFHDYRRVAAQLVLGERLVLRREPGNPHDANAIEIVRADGAKLGYVPRRAAADLAPMLDAGTEVEARITGFVAPPEPGRGLRLPDGLCYTGTAAGEPIVRLTRV